MDDLTTAGTTVSATARVRPLAALALGLASLVLFLWDVSNPPAPYYDEPLYISAANAFLAGATDPTPEVPPLGKLIVASGIAAFGDNPSGWRALSALFGAFTVIGVFVWTDLLLHDFTLALTAALLTLFNNFLYVMSRIAMMDVLLVAFLIWGLVAFTFALDSANANVKERRTLLLLAGVALGLACACKWNGVDTLAAVIVWSLSLLWPGKRSANTEIRRYQASLKKIGFFTFAVALLAVPAISYSLTYWPLSRGLHRPFDFHDLISMNAFIWHFHRATSGNPAIACPWYSWLLQVSPQRALSYVVGNWAVMWGGLLAIAFCARRFGRSVPHTFLVLLYTFNLLQWAFTPQRSLYYYYYFAASMFLGVAIAVALKDLPQRVFGIRMSLLCVTAAAVIFLFCFPHMAHLESPFDCALGCWP
ncbi:MAG: phospholipid carrier-dependent glycosyltransferase [Terriglobales bacterium]